MLKRLTEIFINATRDKVTKRQIEWIMGDFIYCVYILIMLCAFVAAVAFKSMVGFIVVVLCTLFVLGCWGAFTYHLRKTLLTMLYPQDEKVDENGDSILTSELDILNHTLANMIKNYEKIKEDI